jgi:hypothetical protein
MKDNSLLKVSNIEGTECGDNSYPLNYKKDGKEYHLCVKIINKGATGGRKVK